MIKQLKRWLRGRKHAARIAWVKRWQPEQLELRVDRERIYNDVETGIYVRARYPDDTWETVDIAELSTASLLRWLRSRGGDNPWAEHVVLMLLKHKLPAVELKP